MNSLPCVGRLPSWWMRVQVSWSADFASMLSVMSARLLGCIFLPESSGFLYFPFRTPVFDRNLNFRSAVILFFGIKRSKNLRSKTKAMDVPLGVQSRHAKGTNGTVSCLAMVKLQAATLILLRVEARKLK